MATTGFKHQAARVRTAAAKFRTAATMALGTEALAPMAANSAILRQSLHTRKEDLSRGLKEASTIIPSTIGNLTTADTGTPAQVSLPKQ